MGLMLDFGDGSWEEAGATVRTTLESLHRDVRGNGHPGLLQDVSEVHSELREFIIEFRTREDERSRQEKKRSRVHNVWLGILTGVIVAGFGAVFTWALNFEASHKVSITQHTTAVQAETQKLSAEMPATLVARSH